jgi:hypothetical protein
MIPTNTLDLKYFNEGIYLNNIFATVLNPQWDYVKPSAELAVN